MKKRLIVARELTNANTRNRLHARGIETKQAVEDIFKRESDIISDIVGDLYSDIVYINMGRANISIRNLINEYNTVENDFVFILYASSKESILEANAFNININTAGISSFIHFMKRIDGMNKPKVITVDRNLFCSIPKRLSVLTMMSKYRVVHKDTLLSFAYINDTSDIKNITKWSSVNSKIVVSCKNDEYIDRNSDLYSLQGSIIDALVYKVTGNVS